MMHYIMAQTEDITRSDRTRFHIAMLFYSA